jgi:uncharacterized membrane protein YagU involved in acid resistance
MMAEEKKDTREKSELKEQPMSFMTLVVLTGLVAGIVFSGLAYFAYLFNFTTIPPRVILEPWALGDWKKGWLGTVISIILYGGLSIIAAIIYYALFRRFKSMWAGIAYGLALFLLIFLVLHPLFPGIDPFNKLTLNTIVTSVCFYALYGLFIGYTISYEEHTGQEDAKGDKEEVLST